MVKFKPVLLHVGFYNCRVGRPNKVLVAEIKALLSLGLGFLGLCETVGYKLPKIKGYTLIRDTSSASRANVAAYVRTPLYGGKVVWHDLKETWLRQHANTQHPPRAFFTVRLSVGDERVRAMVGHFPPKQPHRPDPAQQARAWDESKEAFAKVLRNSKRPIFALADWNGDPGVVAAAVDGAHDTGAKIDGAVFRDIKISDVGYPTHVGDLPLKTDHKHAFVAKMEPQFHAA